MDQDSATPPTKLISFDIGIRNMAYCIFDISHSVIISDWNVLNLLDKQESAATCTCCLAAKKVPKNPKKPKNTIVLETPSTIRVPEPKICGKRAKYEKLGKYYCETHAKSTHDYLIPIKAISSTVIKKKKLEELIELYTRYNVEEKVDEAKRIAVFRVNAEGPEGIRSSLESFDNLEEKEQSSSPLLKNHTKKYYLAKIIEFFEKRCFTILGKGQPKAQNATGTDLITIGRNMRTQMDSVIGINDITHVIMENQISPIAGRMKTVQGMLAQYFIMKSPPVNSQNSPSIEFISSANKLKDFKLLQTPSNSFDMRCTSPEFSRSPPLTLRLAPTSFTEFITAGSSPTLTSLIAPARSTTQIPKITPKSIPNEDGIVEPKATDREKYKKHKTDSIFICSQFLKTNDNLSSWSNVLLTPKKDDLADCFLQGIWYLKREKIITYAENLKINSMYLS